MNCIFCGVFTNNPRYCSRSCAAKHTNKIYPKRKPVDRFCQRCLTLLPIGSRRQYCSSCCYSSQVINKTLGELRAKRTYQAHTHVREHARRVFKLTSSVRYCEICGYDKHYEICHKKSIDSFDNLVLLSVINNIDNLVALCPNCHWEFDNGLIKIP